MSLCVAPAIYAFSDRLRDYAAGCRLGTRRHQDLGLLYFRWQGLEPATDIFQQIDRIAPNLTDPRRRHRRRHDLCSTPAPDPMTRHLQCPTCGAKLFNRSCKMVVPDLRVSRILRGHVMQQTKHRTKNICSSARTSARGRPPAARAAGASRSAMRSNGM